MDDGPRALTGAQTMWSRSPVTDTYADRRAQEGRSDERADAFRTLTDEELDYSYRLANAILDDPTEAEDAVHDAVVAAWQKWRGLRDPAKFEPWFRSIVVNKCRDRLRRSRRFEMSDIRLDRTDK